MARGEALDHRGRVRKSISKKRRRESDKLDGDSSGSDQEDDNESHKGYRNKNSSGKDKSHKNAPAEMRSNRPVARYYFCAFDFVPINHGFQYNIICLVSGSMDAIHIATTLKR
jgi:hypothetical protein